MQKLIHAAYKELSVKGVEVVIEETKRLKAENQKRKAKFFAGFSAFHIALKNAEKLDKEEKKKKRESELSAAKKPQSEAPLTQKDGRDGIFTENLTKRQREVLDSIRSDEVRAVQQVFVFTFCRSCNAFSM